MQICAISEPNSAFDIRQPVTISESSSAGLSEDGKARIAARAIVFSSIAISPDRSASNPRAPQRYPFGPSHPACRGIRERASARSPSEGTRNGKADTRSEEHTSELQSPDHLVCRLLLEKKKKS